MRFIDPQSFAKVLHPKPYMLGGVRFFTLNGRASVPWKRFVSPATVSNKNDGRHLLQGNWRRNGHIVDIPVWDLRSKL